MSFSALPRRLPKPSIWLGLALLVPLALAFVLARQASWRPVTIQCESNRPPQHILVAYAPDGHYVAIASAHHLRLWDVWHSSLAQELTVADTNQMSLAFAPDSRSVLAIYRNVQSGHLIVWDIVANQYQQIPLRFQNETYESPWPAGLWPVTDAAQPKCLIRTEFRPAGKVKIDDEDGEQEWRVLLCDAPTGRMLKMLTLKGVAVPTNCALSPDGQYLAFRSVFSTVSRLKPDQGGLAVLNTRDSHIQVIFPSTATAFVNGEIKIMPLNFSADSQFLACGTTYGAVEVWSLQSRKLLVTLKDPSAEVEALAFAPDGKLLASGSQDKTVKLWSLSDGKLLRTLKSHTAGIYSLAFSPDSASLASGSADGTVKLWRVR